MVNGIPSVATVEQAKAISNEQTRLLNSATAALSL